MVEKTIYIDESGNFGKRGRYFTITGVLINTDEEKKLLNKMKNTTRQVKVAYPKIANRNGEVKAAESNIVAREYVIRKMLATNFEVSYICADLHHVQQRLLDNQNILYNYLTSFIVKPIIEQTHDLTKLTVIIDERNSSVKNGSPLGPYLKEMIWITLGKPDIDVEVHMLQSHQHYGLQIADFICHAIHCNIEYVKTYYPTHLKSRFACVEHFPYRNFGK